MAFRNATEPPRPVPPINPVKVAHGISVVQPLSRRGVGPGMIVLVPSQNAETPIDIEDGVPSVRMKWAEESYCVVEIRPEAWFSTKEKDPLTIAIEALSSHDRCTPKDRIGLICYDTSLWEKASSTIASLKNKLAGAVLYAEVSEYADLAAKTDVPTIYHLTGKSETNVVPRGECKVYEYAEAGHGLFSVPFHKDFHYATEAVSHSRNLSFLKPKILGPYFDLESIWEEHTFYEFAARNVEDTMNTMVQEPYVNHVPTVMGGVGRESLTAFYRDHFVFQNPKDTELELISRTVGVDRVVDEFIYKFTHDTTIDWLFPGVPPTHKYVEIPMMAVVNVRGDRLYHEHIVWDQATALRQIGVLPQTLPLNVPIAAETNGVASDRSSESKLMNIRLPVSGAEAVRKMRDKNSVESNQMFYFNHQ